MKEPKVEDKKYWYIHKKLVKKMFNAKLYQEDRKKYSEFLKANQKPTNI